MYEYLKKIHYLEFKKNLSNFKIFICDKIIFIINNAIVLFYKTYMHGMIEKG